MKKARVLTIAKSSRGCLTIFGKGCYKKAIKVAKVVGGKIRVRELKRSNGHGHPRWIILKQTNLVDGVKVD